MKQQITRWIITLIFLGGWGATSVKVYAEQKDPTGISFYVLRVIYPESEKGGVTLRAYNKTPNAYLMQSWIRPVDFTTGDVDLKDDGHTAMPFIITPPLQRFEPGEELALRIRRAGAELPKDRESVYFISMKAIPSQSKPKDEQISPQVNLAIVSNMKLFYRPDGLPESGVAGAAPDLKFSLQGDMLVANNPTPFWLTFSHLSVGGYALDKSQLRLMVPPKGQQQYHLPPGTRGDVEWQLIDEDGWNTAGQRQSPSSH
ncbi:fimbrial biogenesis chaperone [Budvicia diplopodorum]|uniref:fimbrial biogenesis chaperone n=1 Tax=Budvicia diplopodorum TaxID=1119056 RepID=UPI00135CA8F2|nr:molecular chaperone [Budvicia diplopodorum]